MFGALLRLVVVIVVLGAAAAFFLGYRISDAGIVAPAERVDGPDGRPSLNTTKAREAGAAVGEKVAVGANEAQRALGNAALTAKIKAKMALDDTVKSAPIDVDTTAGVVTLTGTVRSATERTRAVQLARETAGVKSVDDKLAVR